jgi:ankyrin repeat protein
MPPQFIKTKFLSTLQVTSAQVMNFMRTLRLTLDLLYLELENLDRPSLFKRGSHDKYDNYSCTMALLDAALAGNLIEAHRLVSNGANPNAKVSRDYSNQLCRKQIQYRHLPLLHHVAVGADSELEIEGIDSALMFALQLENVEMLSILLDFKPIELITHENVQALLFASVNLPSPRSLKVLLDRGAPIDLPDSSGYTIMMQAIDSQYYEFAKWLLLQGASVHTQAHNGYTPAYSVQFYLLKLKIGSLEYNMARHLKTLMASRGAVFPALSPDQVNAKIPKCLNALGSSNL